MASNVRAFPSPMVMPPQPSQQGWMWNGTNWCWDPDDPCNCPPVSPPPFPCPPSGFPTPCPPWFPPPAGQAPWYPGANGGVSFSATAPVNPVRGNFWWDGTLLHLFDGAAWVSIGPGVPSIPSPGPGPGPVATTTIVFAIQQPAALAVSATAWTILPFGASPLTDTQTGWSSVTFKYTPKVAGNYFVEIRAIALSTGSCGLAIVKNDSGSFTGTSGSDIVVGVVNVGTSSANSWMTASGIVSMNGTTDFIRVWGYENGGSIPAAGSSPVYTAVLFP